MCNVITLTGKNIGEYCKIKSRKNEKCWLHTRRYIDVTIQDEMFSDETEYQTQTESEPDTEYQIDTQSEPDTEYQMDTESEIEQVVNLLEYQLAKLKKLINLKNKDQIISPGQRKSKVIHIE